MLENIELFEDLSPREITDLAEITRRCSLKRGETIFSQGDFSRDFYVIESGQIEISVNDLVQGTKPIALLRNGDFFGEMALFEKNAQRSANARAVQNTTLIILAGSEFERLLKEKPSISYKLLAGLSRRLRATTHAAIRLEAPPAGRDGKVITVSSARSGYGKTLFATSLAFLLAHELPRQVVFVDLDLPLAEGTFYMGVYSPKNIAEFSRNLVSTSMPREDIVKMLVNTQENLYCLPGTNSLLDAEKVQDNSLISMVKILRKHFDYVILDTDSNINEVFLNALDMSDHLFFLVTQENALTLKSNIRFIHGLSQLNFAPDRVHLLASMVEENFNPEKLAKHFQFPFVGALPRIPEFVPTFGKTAYHLAPNGPYINVIRQLVRNLFQEKAIVTNPTPGFFYRLLFNPGSEESHNQEMSSPLNRAEEPRNPSISESQVRVLLKLIQTNLLEGYLSKAKKMIFNLLESCQGSSLLFQLLGETLAQERNLSQACDAFNRSLLVDPKNYMAKGFLAGITQDQPLLDRAIAMIEEKIKSAPMYPDQHNDLGRLLLETGDFAKAAACFGEALMQNPGYTEARVNLAMALGRQKLFREALIELGQVETKSLRVYQLMGTYFYEMGRFAEALRSYRKAAANDGENENLCSRLSTLEAYFQRIFHLIELHRNALESHPEYPDLHCQLGSLYQLSGRYDLALKEFQEALNRNPGYVEARKLIETLGRLPRYPVDEEERSSTAPGGIRVPDLPFSMRLTLNPAEVSKIKENADATLRVELKNLHAEKQFTWDLAIGPQFEDSIDLDISSMGPFQENDLFLVHAQVAEADLVLATQPYRLSEGDLDTRQLDLKLETPVVCPLTRQILKPPFGCFLLTVKNRKITELLSRDPDKFQAVLTNTSRRLTAVGEIFKFKPDETEFLISTTDAGPIVQSGEHWILRLINDFREEIHCQEFTIPIVRPNASRQEVILPDFLMEHAIS